MKKELLKNIFLIVCVFLSILTLDFGTRLLLYKDIDFVSITYLPPLIFDISYSLIILLIYLLKQKSGKITHILFITLFSIYSIVQIVHFNILDRVITMTDILIADQAGGMLGYALGQLKIYYFIPIIISIILLLISLKILKKANLNITKEKKLYTIFLLLILIFSTRLLAITTLGNKVEDNNWNFWNNTKNIYLDYNSPSRSFIISGTYEYFFRDIYTYFRDLNKKEKNNSIKEINNYITNLNYQKENNQYTNIFKDKNLIMIMLESIDSWLVTEEVMPTLTNLKNTGIDFINRYSPTFGSGATINTEFASLTGLYATVTNNAIYRYDKNNFNYSLPHLFKENGYSVNSVHMNTGSFYNRNKLHTSLGFENHYALSDLIKNVDFKYDTNLVKNDESYNYIINKNNKFLTFITTYSAHVPYVNNKMCDKLNTKKFEIKNDEETTCAKTLANETDNFIKLLIENLKKDNLLDNTILVFFTDHYTYGYSNSSKWTNIKDSKLSQNTSFVIWNNNIEQQKIDIFNDTADIPITLFNMFGIDYNPKLYMGTDIFSKYHEEFVYFNDYTWTTNKLYFTGKRNSNDINYIKNISNKVNNKIKINEKMITSNFYKYYKDTN